MEFQHGDVVQTPDGKFYTILDTSLGQRAVEGARLEGEHINLKALGSPALLKVIKNIAEDEAR